MDKKKNKIKIISPQAYKKATKIIKAASNTLEAGKGLWEKIKPIFGKLRIWLGVAIDYFN